MAAKPFEPKGDVARWVPVYENLRDLEPGVLVTYEQLSEWAGVDVRRDRSPLVQAEDKLLKEHGRGVANERGVGYRIMLASEHGEAARRQTRKADRRIRKAITLLTVADRNHLTPQQRQKYESQAGALQAVRDMTNRLARRTAALEEGLKAVRRETKETTAGLSDRLERLEARFANVPGDAPADSTTT
jgi:hypothetical protein